MAEDNPFFPDNLLEKYEALMERDPDEAKHVYLGYPRNNQTNAVWLVSDVMDCTDENRKHEKGTGRKNRNRYRRCTIWQMIIL